MSNLVWTHHAKDRFDERGIDHAWVDEAFSRPDTKEKTRDHGWRYRKRFGKKTITLVLTQNEKREWILLSVWMDPPLPGTVDAKRKEEYKIYKKAKVWKKLFLLLKGQLGF